MTWDLIINRTPRTEALRLKTLLAVTQPSCTPLQKRLCSGTLRFALQAYLAWPAFLCAACCVFSSSQHHKPNGLAVAPRSSAPLASLAPLAGPFMLSVFFCPTSISMTERFNDIRIRRQLAVRAYALANLLLLRYQPAAPWKSASQYAQLLYACTVIL